jgi:hypothetical protein
LLPVEDKRLLVLGAGPAQCGALAAARALGVTVVAADRDPAALGFVHAARRAIVSVEDEPALERLARAERVDGVLAPGSDRSIGIAARIAAKLGLPHPVSPQTAVASTSRLRTRQRLEAAGVPQPRGIVCRTLDELSAAAVELGFPCGVTAADRQQRATALDAAALAGALAEALADSRADTCVAEEIPRGELTVNAFAVDGAVYAFDAPDPDVAALVASAAGALGIVRGPITARVAAGPLVVRIAPRVAGADEAKRCRAETQIDVNVLAASAALGEPVRLRTPDVEALV